MIASLPMYDRPALRAAHDRLWAALDLGLPRLAPEDLWDHWRAPGLLFSQTCALPYAMGLYRHLTVIASPDFRLPDCPAGYYNSVIVTRPDDPRDHIAQFAAAPVAYNQPHSQSGWGALYAFAKQHDTVLSNLIQTGGHAASAQAVIERTADLACLDAQTHRLLAREIPQVAGLRILAHTPPQPAMPYVTALPERAPQLRAQLAAALAGLSPTDRDTLGLYGITEIAHDAYLALPIPPEP